MKKIIGKIMFLAGIVFGATLFIAGFLAYFITSNRDGIAVDGLGRPLSLSPLIVRMIFGQERLWAGFLWFIGDMVIFWSGVGLIYLLITNGIKFSEGKK